MPAASDSPQPHDQPDAPPRAIDRFAIFEAVALERLQAAEPSHRAIVILPLPVRLTLIAAATISGLGVLWAILARVPIQVNGTAAIVQRGVVGTLRAPATGILRFQVSGIGPDRLTEPEQLNNQRLSRFWHDPVRTAWQPLLGAALAQNGGVTLMLPEDQSNNRDEHRLATSVVHVPGGTLLAVIDDELARRQLADQERISPARQRQALIRFLERTRVFAPRSGVFILSKYQRNGAPVNRGDALLSYSSEPPALPDQLPLFLDGVAAQQVSEGMEVLMTPRGISRAQYGGIRGKVVEVGRLPLAAEQLIGVLGTPAMVRQIEPQLPAPYLAWIRPERADLKACRGVRSRHCYRWSSGRLPPHPVRLNTVADVLITTGYRHPIDVVTPALRRAVGVVNDDPAPP